MRLFLLLLACTLVSAPVRAEPIDLLFDEQDSVMTATESQRELGQAPSVVTVITEKQIRDMGAQNLLEVLESVPGFMVSYPSDIASGHTLSIRGLKSSEAEKTLLMINGHRVNNPYSGSWTFLFDELPLDEVRRIEIIRGPGSALYGSNAMLAVIHVITRTADTFRASTVDVSAGSHRFVEGHASSGGESNGTNLMFSLNASSNDGDRQWIPRDAAGRSGVSNFWRKQQSGFLSITHGNWSLFAMHANKRRGTILDASNQIDTRSDVSIRQSFATLEWNKPHDDWDLMLRTEGDLFSLMPLWQFYGGGMLAQPQLRNLTLTQNVRLRYRGWRDHEWTLHGSFDHIRQFDVRTIINGADLTAMANHNRDVTRRVWSLAIQDEWLPLGALAITAGARLEHYSDVGGHVSPRLAAVWHAADNLDIKAMYGHAFRAPNFIELYSANNTAILGNPNVKPEIVDTYELGANWRQGIWQISANLYESRFRNLITRIPPDPKTINVGKETLRGLEFEWRIDASKELYGSIAYTWQRGSSSLSGAIPDVPNHMARLSGDAPLPLDAHLHADLHWIGSMRRAAGDPRPPLPATWQLDTVIRIGSPANGPSASLVARNLFNQTIYSPMANPHMSDIPFHGREWLLNLSWTF